MDRLNAPIFAMLAAVAAAVAVVSLVSARAIGAHDGALAYLIVFGTGCALVMVSATLVCMTVAAAVTPSR